MIRSEEHWLSIIDALQSASIGGQRWEIGLQAFADATGSRSAQLTGIDSSRAAWLSMGSSVMRLPGGDFSIQNIQNIALNQPDVTWVDSPTGRNFRALQNRGVVVG